MKKPQDPHGKGVPGLDRHGWVTLAEREVYTLINTGLAVPHLEIEARLWEHGTAMPHGRVHFFPHILSEATNNLARDGVVDLISHTTKGAAAVELYVPQDTRLRTAAVTAAARRKAMLYARFTRLSSTFGEAGEAVVRSSLLDATPHGYLPITQTPIFGPVSVLAGVHLPGALDSGSYAVLHEPDALMPTTHTIPIEVKNRRLTLYPRHPEVHQLLAKAAMVQAAAPTAPIVPLLICRRAHDRLFWMAKDLGFLVHQTKAQFFTMPKGTTDKQIQDVRTELALTDLKIVSPTTQPRIGLLFASTIPKTAGATAVRWAAVGQQLQHHYALLRQNITHDQRNEALADLRTEAAVVLEAAGIEEPILAWALEEPHEPY